MGLGEVFGLGARMVFAVLRVLWTALGPLARIVREFLELLAEAFERSKL